MDTLGNGLDVFDNASAWARQPGRHDRNHADCRQLTIIAISRPSHRSKQGRNPCDGWMMIDTGWQSRKADDPDARGKSFDAGDRIVQRNRIALALTNDDRSDRKLSLRQDVERGERVADGAEIAPHDEQ